MGWIELCYMPEISLLVLSNTTDGELILYELNASGLRKWKNIKFHLGSPIKRSLKGKT